MKTTIKKQTRKVEVAGNSESKREVYRLTKDEAEKLLKVFRSIKQP